jgi:hypothetical protein
MAVVGALAAILSHEEVAQALDALDYDERVRLLSNLMSVTIRTPDRDAATMLALGGGGTVTASVEFAEEET